MINKPFEVIVDPQIPKEVCQDERIFPGYLLAMAWPEASKDRNFTAVAHEALVFATEHYDDPGQDEAFREGAAFVLETLRRQIAQAHQVDTEQATHPISE